MTYNKLVSVLYGPLLLVIILIVTCSGDIFAEKLYHDLLIGSGYNKLIRPVGNVSERGLTVKIGLRLTQIINVVSTGDDYLILILIKSPFLYIYKSHFKYFLLRLMLLIS